MYKFVSSRQLIFKVAKPGGQQAIVYFSERDMNGVSAYLTDDEYIAQAIMRHSFFKKGILILAEAPAKSAGKAAETEPSEGAAETEPSAGTAETEPETETGPESAETEQETTEEGTETEESEAETTGTVTETTETEPGVMTFPNITIAKDYLHRTYGVKKEEIRSLPKVIAYAESKGLTIKIGD